VDDSSCNFCSKSDSVQHVFFDCVVAKQCWCMIYNVVNVKVGDNLIEIENFGLAIKNMAL